MKLAGPELTYELQQPEGPALASLAETQILETLQSTMTMDMKIGIAAGNAGEIVVEGNHRRSRLVFWRPAFGHNRNQLRARGALHRRLLLKRSSAESRANHSVSPIESHRI